MELKDQQDHKVSKDRQELTEHKVNKDRKVKSDHKDLQEPMEPKVKKVTKEILVT